MKKRPMAKPISYYWLYGKHSVVAAIKNPKRICRKLLMSREAQVDLKTFGVNIDRLHHEVLSSSVITKIWGLQDAVHQGIALHVAVLEQPSIDELLERLANQSSSIIVILDHVTDPQNVGAIIRSALGFSADAIVITHHQSAKESAALVKASCGAFEKLPMTEVVNLVDAIKKLKSAGYWIFGLSGHAQQNLSDLTKHFDGKVAIVMGSEGSGMRRLTSDNCDFLAKILISDDIESLNISNAAAIALYEIAKYQKNKL